MSAGWEPSPPSQPPPASTCKETCLHHSQVRALTSTSFKSDPVKFEAMARASLRLCRAYVDIHLAAGGQPAAGSSQPSPSGGAAEKGAAAGAGSGAGGGAGQGGSLRDLSAARMHLRGVLKQCEGAFGEHALQREMGDLLEEVLALEQRALGK